MRRYDAFWMSDPDWYDMKNGVLILKEDAPAEAQESFNRYLEQKGFTKEQWLESINAPIVEDE